MPLEPKQIKILTDNVAAPLADAFGSAYFGAPVGKIFGGLSKFIGVRIANALDGRDVERRLATLADGVARSLIPIFEDNQRASDALAPVCAQLSEVVHAIAEAGYLIGKKLDAQQILADIQEHHPLPLKQLSELETQLYARSLEHIIRTIIEVAPDLPRFDIEHVRRHLQMLDSLGSQVNEVGKDVHRILDVVSRLSSSDADISVDQRFEIEYRLTVARESDYMELFGADIPTEAR